MRYVHRHHDQSYQNTYMPAVPVLTSAAQYVVAIGAGYQPLLAAAVPAAIARHGSSIAFVDDLLLLLLPFVVKVKVKVVVVVVHFMCSLCSRARADLIVWCCPVACFALSQWRRSCSLANEMETKRRPFPAKCGLCEGWVITYF